MVQSVNKLLLEPMSTKIFVAIWRHWATICLFKYVTIKGKSLIHGTNHREPKVLQALGDFHWECTFENKYALSL